MMKNKLPKTIPIFPLSNAVFFPHTLLPLNIFEKRYLQLVEDSIKNGRLFGMVQPRRNKSPEDVYKIGCLGKIISFNETADNRFIITLSGVIRFKIIEELQSQKLYREFSVNYDDFISDLNVQNDELKDYDKKNLLQKIKSFFDKINYSVEFNQLLKLNFDQLVNTVCMIAPFSTEEKQKLIETIKVQDKLKNLEEIINFHLMDLQENKTIQ
tara:strand:- start:997 stop:1632 length:636 start_codon:yes stop_codon:yes gene_type:complete